MDKVNVYSQQQARNIASEFVRTKETCYLDNTGAALYSEKQLENIFKDFSTNVYANPHARSISSQSTNDAVDVVRYKILSFFKTSPEEYSVIFTSGATSALKMIAETFRFNGGCLAYLEDNHSSVLGMRCYAPEFREIKVDEAFDVLSFEQLEQGSEKDREKLEEENCLFVYPAQSNFAGSKYPLTWISAIKRGSFNQNSKTHQNWYTVLDAACFASTNQLDLKEYQPDFVTISFYKIFGYPTGLGALLVKRSSEHLLEKKYFGGGTILMALSSQNVMIPKQNIHERFEDGTISFLSILSLTHGFDTFRRLQLTPDLISKHTFNIGKYTFNSLLALHHANGEPVAVMNHEFGFDSIKEQGGIINFNLKRGNGDYVGYAEVLHIASLHGILLRTGCFCNPGACQKALRLTSKEVKKHFETGHVCGDEHDLIDGWPTGSIRIAFGYASTFEDADRFLRMIKECFVMQPVVIKQRGFSKTDWRRSQNVANQKRGTNQSSIINRPDIKGTLRKIYLYPVKSCAPFEVKGSWKLTSLGLDYDRRWMIINPSGSCVSQKQIKNLCTLKPILDFDLKLLRLKMNNSEVSVPLNPHSQSHKDAFFCDSQVCGDKVQGFDCGDKVSEWLSDNLEKPGLRLLRQCDFTEDISGRKSKQGPTLLSLANKAEYLLINLASIRWLLERIPKEEATGHSVDSIVARFRANFVVDFPEAFVENNLDELFVDDIQFKFSGVCARCQMICIDQQTGEISKEPLQTLSKELRGKMRFGAYLSQINSSQCKDGERLVKIGSSVNANYKRDSED